MPSLDNSAQDDPLAMEGCDSFSGGQVSNRRSALLAGNQAASLKDVVFSTVDKLQTRVKTQAVGVAPVGSQTTDTASIKGIVLTGFSEFVYKGDAVLLNSSGQSLNAILDERVNSVDPTSPQCRTDISVMLDRLEEKYTELQDVLVWINWFYPGDLSTGPKPGISPGVVAALVDPDDWQVDGVNATTGMAMAGDLGGTPDDASVVWLFDELKSRGYRVGLYLVPYENSTSAGWRGEISWPDSGTFGTWMDDYEAFIKHYIDLLNASAASAPDYVILGSEMRSSSQYDAANGFPFIDRLISLAAYSKSIFPDAKTIYAADWTEYAHFNNGGQIYFPLDRLWAHDDLDFVGIDFYPPMTEDGQTVDEETLLASLTSGAQWDFYRNSPGGGDGGRSYSTSTLDDRGFSLVGNNPLSEHFRLKDIARWRQGIHFEVLPDNTTKARSAENHEEITMQASMAMGASASASAGGVWLPDEMPTCWLTLENNKYATWTAPSYGTSYVLEADIEINGASSGFPRLFRIENVIDVFADTGAGVIKAQIFHASGNVYTNGVPYTNGTRFVYRLVVTATGNTYTELKDGVAVNSAQAIGGTPVDLTGSAFINTYSNSSDFFTGKLYSLMISGTQDDTWTFEDATLGTRSIWEPEAKKIFVSEFGVASITSSPVEPNVFPDFHSNPSDPTGPFNSSFQQAQALQKLALQVLIEYLETLVSSGDVEALCVYNIDARPHEALTEAMAGSDHYYADYLSYPYTHNIDGKDAEDLGQSFQIIGDGEGGDPVEGLIQALVDYRTPEIQKLIAVILGKAYELSDGIWLPYFDLEGSGTNQTIDVIQLTNKLFATGDDDGALYSYDGNDVSRVTDGPVGATILEKHGTRIVAGGYPGSTEFPSDAVDFSDLLDGSTWDFVNQRLQIGGGDGDPVTAFKSWLDSSFVIWKENSTWIVEASPLADVAEWNVKLVHASIGCVAKKTAAQVGQDIWFLSKSGVQSVQKQLATSNNEITLPVSYPIQDEIDRIDWSNASEACAVFHNNLYILSAPMSDGSIKTFVFNYLTSGWVVFTGWTARQFLSQPYNGRSRLLFGDETGAVYEWLDYLIGTQDSDQNYQGVDSEILTRGLIFGDPAAPKSPFNLEMEIDKTGCQLTVSAIVDGGDEVIVFDKEIQRSGFRFPLTFPLRFKKRGYLRRQVNLQSLPQFRELQFKLASSGGRLVLRRLIAAAFNDTLETRDAYGD